MNKKNISIVWEPYPSSGNVDNARKYVFTDLLGCFSSKRLLLISQQSFALLPHPFLQCVVDGNHLNSENILKIFFLLTRIGNHGSEMTQSYVAKCDFKLCLPSQRWINFGRTCHDYKLCYVNPHRYAVKATWKRKWQHRDFQIFSTFVSIFFKIKSQDFFFEGVDKKMNINFSDVGGGTKVFFFWNLNDENNFSAKSFRVLWIVLAYLTFLCCCC